MASLKRKEAPVVKSRDSVNHKKPKRDVVDVKNATIAVHTLEAETDSDPIVESDTNSQSGDDDGVSWPSDGDEDAAHTSALEEESNLSGAEVSAVHTSGVKNNEEKSAKNKDVTACRIRCQLT